jgi:PAS domain S-box-containing protein
MKRVPSLRNLLLFVMLIFSLLLGSIQFFSMIYTYQTEVLSQSIQKLRYSATSLSSNLEYALAYQDERLVRHLVAQQIAYPHLRYAAYVAPSGLIHASTDVLGIGKALFELAVFPDENKIHDVAQTRQGLVFHDPEHKTLWAVFPVNPAPGPGELRAAHPGLAVVALETTYIHQAAVRKATLQALIIVLPLFLLAGIVTLLMKRFLTDRVEQLLAYVTQHVRSRTDSLIVGGADELGQLGEKLTQIMDELRLSRDFYFQLLEKMPNPIWRAGTDGRCIHFNAAWLAFTGRSLEEEMGEGWMSGIHPDDIGRVVDIYTQAFEKREVFAMEYRLHHHDGAYHSIIDHGEPIFDSNGGFAGYVGSCFDIEPQCRGARILAASESKFRGLVESSLAGVYLIQHEHLMYANPRLAGWLGYHAEEMTGMPLHAIVHPDDLQSVLERFKQAGPAQGTQKNLRLLRSDGGVLTVDLLDTVIELEHVPAMIGTMLDVSERQAAYEEIQRLNAQLEERVKERTLQLANANKELETFAYSVSHDLKAPLRGIDGYSHLLLEDHAPNLNEEALLFVRNIRFGVMQMGRLIDDLLAYSRMERRHLQKVGLDLRRSVEGILAERAGDARLAHATVTIEMPAISILADPDGLAQVLRNLIDNAIKYSQKQESPIVRIAAHLEGPTCCLSVCDNGIGFDMRFAERIFEIFQRLERAEDYSGTGVGLAIARKAVLRMGGRIHAQSTPGQGACFYVELPKA